MTLILKTYSRRFSNYRLMSTATTVDINEIEHFKSKFTDWWDEFGFSKALHAMNKVRVPLIRDGLINEGAVKKENIDTGTPLKGLSILDVGCGGGILTEALAKIGASMTGLDANACVIDQAKCHAEQNHLPINYLFASIEDHAKDNCEKYDAIAASEIIEHVTEKEQFIAACAKCLKPNGSLFITTLNKTLMTDIFAIYVAENIVNVLPKGTHHIEKCIEPHKLQRILEDCNLRTKLIHGMFYNPIKNSWGWCSDTYINYGLHAVKMEKN